MAQLLLHDAFRLAVAHQAAKHAHCIPAFPLYLGRLLVAFVPEAADNLVELSLLVALEGFLGVGLAEVVFYFGFEVR